MNLCLLSDLHGHLPELKRSDLCIIAGDICPDMINFAESQMRWIEDSFLPWLEKVPAECVLMVWGNHDFVGHVHGNMIDEMMPPHCRFLHNELSVYNDVRVWGTPYSHCPPNWAFNADEAQMENIFRYVPENTDIIVSHGPPAGIRDLTRFGDHLGSSALRRTIQAVAPKLVVCGHIHEDRGVGQLKGTIVHNVALAPVYWNDAPFAPTYITYPEMVAYEQYGYTKAA